MIGGFVAPYIRKVTPRAGLLGTLAGVSVAFISMPGDGDLHDARDRARLLRHHLASWFGGVRYPRGIPAGLVAIAVGMVIAWGPAALAIGVGGMSLTKLADSFANFGFSIRPRVFGL